MKKEIYVLGLFALLLFACKTQNEKKNMEVSNVAKSIANAHLKAKVSGMSCTGCKKMIEKAFANTKGVSQCTVDFATMVASIDYDNTQISESEILKVFTTVGEGHYTAVKIE